MIKVKSLRKENNNWYTFFEEGSEFPHYFKTEKNITLEELNNSIEKLEKEGIYDFNTLLIKNGRFNKENILKDSDVKKVNSFIDLIKKEELVGQTVHIITPKGVKYNALIESESHDCKVVRAVMNASAHVFNNDSKIGLSCSGGYFQLIKVEDLIETENTYNRTFWTWGNCGPKGDGGIYFNVKTKMYNLTEEASKEFY